MWPELQRLQWTFSNQKNAKSSDALAAVLLNEGAYGRKRLLHRLAAREEMIPAFQHCQRDALWTHLHRTIAFRRFRCCRSKRLHEPVAVANRNVRVLISMKQEQRHS